MNRIIFLLFVLLFSVSVFSAQTKKIVNANGNGDFLTISSAIASAVNGDTIYIIGTITGDGVPVDGIVVDKSLIIQGQGAEQTIVEAAATEGTADRRVFTINSDLEVTIRDLSVRFGNDVNEGAGLYAKGYYRGNYLYPFSSKVNIQNCKFLNNNASFEGGGIMVGEGILFTINNSQIENNNAERYGGGISTSQSIELNITNCTFHKNNSETGGGLYIYRFCQTRITNCTFFENVAKIGGGAIYNEYPSLAQDDGTSITNTTIVKNQCSISGGGGIHTNSLSDMAKIRIKNSLIANNTTNGLPNDFEKEDDLETVVDNGNNIIEFSNYLFEGSGTLTGEQSNLNIADELQLNSSINQTTTLKLNSGSIAINAGGFGENGIIEVPLYDQRGLIKNGPSDIGAFEFNAYNEVFADCMDTTLFLDENGALILSAQQIVKDTGMFTGFNSKLLSQSVFDCSNIGENKVTFAVEDLNGNTSTCVSNVTIQDSTSPVVLCNNVTIQLDSTGNARLTASQVENGVTDNCSFFTEEQNQNSIELLELEKQDFNCTDLGENMVTLQITDNSGNIGMCMATITVVDTIFPVVEPISSVEVLLEPGICETQIEYPEIVVYDNCNVTLIQTQGLGAEGFFTLGVTTEKWTVTDGQGNTAEVSFDVIISTTNAPPSLDTIADIRIPGDTIGITIPLTGISGGNDCPSQEVTIVIQLDNTAFIPLTNISYEPGESTAELYLEFASDLSETAQIIVKVSDSEGAFVEDTFNVCIYCYPLNIVEQGDKEFQIKLYPNPTNGRVNIDLTTIGNTSKLKVLNSIGEEIFQRNYNFVNHIDFSLLGKESGLYFVILEHGGRIYSRKLVITE